MKRDVFDNIWKFPEGCLFLLNLLDSCDLNLLAKDHVNGFLNDVEIIPHEERNHDKWWLSAIPWHTVASKCVPARSGNEQFSTAICIHQDMDGDPEREFFGDSVINIVKLDEAEEKIFKSRQSRKIYWLSDTTAMNNATTADAVRDRLGLDWAQENMVVYRVSVPNAKAVNAKRPAGLSGGSPRFKARREDETSHLSYQQWGMTVDLEKWRRAKADNDTIVGVPELVADVGPLNSTENGVVARLGITRNPSGCTSEHDHKAFARRLNSNQTVEAEAVYNRLTVAINGLTT
jgi:hypothetical protein